MKFKFIAVFMLIASGLMAQSKIVHKMYLEQTVKLESGESDSILVQFAPEKVGGGIWKAPGLYDGIYIDSLASDPLPYTNWQTRNTQWEGYAEFELYITNVDLATDSMQVAVYALDRDGYAQTNDVVYLKFDTYPGYSTSAYYNGTWVTATYYKSSITGAFGYGTHGLLIVINPNDDTASKSGTLRLRANIY